MSAARMVAGFTLVPVQPGFSRGEPRGGGLGNARPRIDPKLHTRPPTGKSKLGEKKGGNFSYPSPFLPKKEALRVGNGLCSGRSKSW